MTIIPTQVTFRGLQHSDSIEAEIRQRVAWLEQFFAGIVRCRVAIELTRRRRNDGRRFHVRIEVSVPGGAPIVVSHEPSLHAGLKDVREQAHHKNTEVERVHRYASVAIREAFDAARRRLEDFAREQRGAVKTHQAPAYGEVVDLEPAGGFGFIQSGEDRIYFHRASVLADGFDQLTVGTQVAFVEERGEQGPQASTVRVLGKRHYITLGKR
jgi:cold shock CspA family protein/ribosome-associated translation inhibitor RaiA